MSQPGDSVARGPSATHVFVKNLNQDVVDDTMLASVFERCGPLVSAKVVKDAAGRSRGYAFVQYEDSAAAKAAIEALNGTSVAERDIFVGPFIPAKDRAGNGKFCNVYVKNLGEGVTEDVLKEVFGRAGPITSAVVMRDPAGRSRGFGFVNFSSADDAARAVAELDGVVPPLGSAGSGGGAGGSGGSGGSAGPQQPWQVSKAQNKNERGVDPRAKGPAERRGEDPQARANLYIKNLEHDMNEDKLMELCQEYGTIQSCKVLRHQDGTCKGVGFVQMSTPAEAAQAIQGLHNRKVGSKLLFVALAQKKQDAAKKYPPYVGFGMGMPGTHLFPPGMAFYPPGAGMGFGQHLPLGYGQHPGAPPHLMHAWGPHPHAHARDHAMGAGNPMAAFPQHLAPPHMAHPMLGPHALHAGGYGAPPPPGMEFAMGPWGGAGMAAAWYNGASGSGSVHMGMGPGAGRGGAGGGQARGRGRGLAGPAGKAGPGALLAPEHTNGPPAPVVAPRAPPPRRGAHTNGPAPPPPASVAGPSSPGAQPPFAPPTPAQAASLSVELSTAASPDQRRAALGEKLFPLVAARDVSNAAKVTGMLLEMGEPEVLGLLSSPADLARKVAEATRVLRETGQFVQPEAAPCSDPPAAGGGTLGDTAAGVAALRI